VTCTANPRQQQSKTALILAAAVESQESESPLDLIERFERNLDAYKAGQYNESQLRREFLDPFFKHLGWDIDKTEGYAERYKDVIHEDQIRLADAAKAPDYSFRIGGARKILPRSQKTLHLHQRRPEPRFPTSPLRLDRKASSLHPQRFRRICYLRRPLQTDQRR
jgi:hypothetical protein